MDQPRPGTHWATRHDQRALIDRIMSGTEQQASDAFYDLLDQTGLFRWAVGSDGTTTSGALSAAARRVLHDREDAADAVGEAFLRTFRQVRKWTVPPTGPYQIVQTAYTNLRRAAFDTYRHQDRTRRLKTAVASDPLRPRSAPPADHDLWTGAAVADLRRHLAARVQADKVLPHRQRMTAEHVDWYFAVRVAEVETAVEVVARTGVSRTRVYEHIGRVAMEVDKVWYPAARAAGLVS